MAATPSQSTSTNRKLIFEEWMSLDGYVSDKNEKLDFFASLVRQTYADDDRAKFLETIDTILFGRKTYEQFAALWPQRPVDKEVLADKMNTSKKIVFSNTLKDAPWGKWPAAEIASDNAIATIKKLKSQPGKYMVLWGSICLAQILMKENLIDEYRIHLCPTLTSGGRSLFTTEMNPTTLKLVDIKHYDTGIVFLNYQPLSNL
jgi:dihydrofolate reductase